MVTASLFYFSYSHQHSGFGPLARLPSPLLQQRRSCRCRTRPVLMGLLGSVLGWAFAVAPASASLSPFPGLCFLAFTFPTTAQGGLWQCQAGAGKRFMQLMRAGSALHCLSSLVWPPPWPGPGARSRATKWNAFQLKKCSSSQYSIYGARVPLLALFLALQTAVKPAHCQRMS